MVCCTGVCVGVGAYLFLTLDIIETISVSEADFKKTFVIIFFLSPVFPSAVAKASSNVSFCKAIFYSEIAFDDCIYDTAIKFKKVEFCGKMKARWNRDRCYNYMASVTEDKSLCGKIELELMRNKCY